MALELFPMELSATIIGIVISILLIIISYVIYRIGIAEKSFEEVIEEQKKRSIEEELKQKSEKVKKEKKFKKTWGKKSKDRIESEMSPGSVQIVETKNNDVNFEIIEPKEIKSMKQKNKSKLATSSQHVIDLPEQEKFNKVDTVPVIQKPISEKKSADIVRVLPEQTDIEVPKQEIPKLEEKEVVQSISVASVQTMTLVPPMASIPTLTSSPPAISQKKKKKEPVEKEVVPMTASKLLLFIKESELEAEEIQNFIDVLLNKQKDTSSWTKKNDTLAITRKNLHEKEQLLDQESQQKKALTSQLKDLREEYNMVKSKLSAQEKTNVETIKRLQQDVQKLTIKAKQMQDQLSAEREKLSKIERESQKKIEETLKSSEEEKNKLLQKISKLEAESRAGISKNDYEIIKKSREDLQKVHMLLVEQHTQLVSKEKNQQAQLSDLKMEIEKLMTQNRTLTDEYNAIKDKIESANVTKKTIEDKLMVEKRHSTELEIQAKQLSYQVTKQEQIAGKLEAEISELRVENERLADQLVSTKERVAGDGQEILQQNGEMNGKSQEIPEKLLDEKDKLLEEKEFSLAQVNDELKKEKAKVLLINEEIEVQKQKNNELRAKNWKAMEALTNAEQKIKEIQLTSDQKLKDLEKDNRNRSVHSDNESLVELTDKLKKSENDLILKLSDYNKELETNERLSSEIVNLKELHKYRIEEFQKTIEELKSSTEKCQLQMKECLQRICPSISISSSLPFENWLLEFEQQSTLLTQGRESSENFEELLEQKAKEYLEKQNYYEQALQETGSTLLNLQESAETQETLWQERLKVKDLELEQIKSEKNALVTEKEAMQSTFQQISQLEELQEKLKLLQTTLENAENERSHLEQKYDEVNKNCLNLRDQLENKEKEILELQKQSNSLDSLNKEIEDLKSKLEKEKKISKDFSSQMIRLNSLVKIGQDSLKTEQEMVKKLKAELEEAKVSTANGTASSPIASSITANESQTKTKNPEKSKKKMVALDKK